MFELFQIFIGIGILLYIICGFGLYYVGKKNTMVVTDDCLLGSFEKVNHYECKKCNDAILFPTDKFCNQCGAKLIWRI